MSADLFLLLELCESDLGFSPLAEEDVSDLLDRKLRLSAGIVFEASPGDAPGPKMVSTKP